MIDTHTHIYLSEFAEDMSGVIERARENNINRVFLPAIDSEHHDDLNALAARYPEFCYPMMGLHPCSVKAGYEKELDLVKELLGKNRYYAIGEIGLDLYWDKSTYDIQLDAFKIQIEWSIDMDLPIVIHSRDAIDESIEALKPYKNRIRPGIFHCFTGNLPQAREIMDLGFYMGIGGVLTYKKSDLPEVLAEIPMEYLVLETDAPYLSPVPYRGKRNEPSYMIKVAEKLAEIKGLTVSEIDSLTTANALSVFKLEK